MKSVMLIYQMLTHWGQVMHVCVSNLTIIGSDNGLSPGRRQAIIWTNAVILLIEPLGINFNEIFIKSKTFSFKKMDFKLSNAKLRPFFLSLSVLTHWGLINDACLHKEMVITGSDNDMSLVWCQNHHPNQCWHIANWIIRKVFNRIQIKLRFFEQH